MEPDVSTARTVIALFEFEEEADRAAEKLVAEGFERDQIGIVAGHELSRPEEYVEAEKDTEGKVIGAVGKGLAFGGGLGAIAGGVSLLLLPGVGPLAVGSVLAATFLGAGLGASVGGVQAGLMKAGVDESDARLFEAALRHGGVVLTVQTDEAMARHAVKILDRSGALDMDEHNLMQGDRGVDQVEGATGGRANDTHRDHSTDRDATPKLS
ncbi:MAG: hypothetical protein H7Y20_12145 [Bryobacteraceae bacterium]|nr:hypothetical protein [Bryobacteraceae bacterium]